MELGPSTKSRRPYAERSGAGRRDFGVQAERSEAFSRKWDFAKWSCTMEMARIASEHYMYCGREIVDAPCFVEPLPPIPNPRAFGPGPPRTAHTRNQWHCLERARNHRGSQRAVDSRTPQTCTRAQLRLALGELRQRPRGKLHPHIWFRSTRIASRIGRCGGKERGLPWRGEPRRIFRTIETDPSS